MPWDAKIPKILVTNCTVVHHGPRRRITKTWLMCWIHSPRCHGSNNKDERIVRIGSRNSSEGAYFCFWGARMPIQIDNNSQAQDVSIGFETMHHQSGWSYLFCFQKKGDLVVSCFPSCSFVVDRTSVIWYSCCRGLFWGHSFPCWCRLKFIFTLGIFLLNAARG